MGVARDIAEIAIGLLFAVGAVFNATYTRTHVRDFYGSFVVDSWFAPGRRLVERIVLPNAAIFNGGVVVFQVAVAVAILSRGDLTTAGLTAGAVFASLAALASSPAGTAGNLALAGIQAALALT
ncbi:MAG: hypothetical protein OEQ47_03040 [Acidimicrobiia bacterium]|nr:hypothetical protein [Acidimicrobiia bacterium]